MQIFSKDMDTVDKIQFSIAYALRFTILVAILGAILGRQWTVLFVSCIILFLTFLPSLIDKNYKINFPIEFELIVVIFIYASLFLGELKGYFTRFWWWDIILHIGSSIALGFAGFLILYILNRKNKVKANPFVIAIFAFSFALALGAIWEIFEFTMDSFFSLNMQKSGLVDTMWDLIVDSGGAIVASTIGFFYIRGKKTHIFQRFISKFIKKNDWIFGPN